MWLRSAALLSLSSVFVACESEGDGLAPEVDPAEQSVIYGTDDRMEWYEVTDQSILNAADSVVVLVDDSLVSRRFNGTWDVYTGYTLQNTVPVCSTEPYRTQPAPGHCSGVLVDDNLIATAGHCISQGGSCNSTAFVFGFKQTSAGVTRTNVADNDVYFCSSVTRRSTGTTDYALVRLDRPVVGHQVSPIRRSSKVATDTNVLLMGHPVGLPLKIVDNGKVKQNSSSSWFGANIDSYTGNSGSPVFNASTLEVEGLLVRGNNDWRLSGRCYVSNTCGDGGCPGFEESTRTTRFSAYVP